MGISFLIFQGSVSVDRAEFIKKCNDKLKLIRTEYNLSQEKAAQVLGLSKKTLVEIEKGRSSLGWAGSVALCTIFDHSEILDATFGGPPTDIILNLAFEGKELYEEQARGPFFTKTLGGKTWWKVVEEAGGYAIQQNIISLHYRILDSDDVRVWFSFDYDQVKAKFDLLLPHTPGPGS